MSVPSAGMGELYEGFSFSLQRIDDFDMLKVLVKGEYGKVRNEISCFSFPHMRDNTHKL